MLQWSWALKRMGQVRHLEFVGPGLGLVGLGRGWGSWGRGWGSWGLGLRTGGHTGHPATLLKMRLTSARFSR
jgi:hypothetical protein